MPVELLRDGRGIYGIGVSDLFDHEAMARSRGINPDPRLGYAPPPRALILRPDKFNEVTEVIGPYGSAVLQKIVGGFRHGMFSHTSEEHLRQFIHHEALWRSGLPWPPPQDDRYRWWSADKKQQARNRAIFHGKRLLSLYVINRLIGKALEEAADADAVRAARQFAFKHRERIYRASAQSRRALQLTDTFPVLALAIYSDSWRLSRRKDFDDDWRSQEAEIAARKKSAAALVERGARLRDVAAAMDLAMALRCVKPGAAHLVDSAVSQHPKLLDFMPTALPRSKIWLRLVGWADHNVDADFGEWAARHVPQIPGRLNEVGAFLGDLADWVRACQGG